MALYTELPLYRDTYKFIQRLFEVTTKFKREYKYTLGQDMKRDAMDLVRYIYRANVSQDKAESLIKFLDAFQMVRLQVRLSYDMKLMSKAEFIDLVEVMDSISKQVTGWRNSYKYKTDKNNTGTD